MRNPLKKCASWYFHLMRFTRRTFSCLLYIGIIKTPSGIATSSFFYKKQQWVLGQAVCRMWCFGSLSTVGENKPTSHCKINEQQKSWSSFPSKNIHGCRWFFELLLRASRKHLLGGLRIEYFRSFWRLNSTNLCASRRTCNLRGGNSKVLPGQLDCFIFVAITVLGHSFRCQKKSFVSVQKIVDSSWNPGH